MQAMSYDSIIKTIMNSNPKEDWIKSSYYFNKPFDCYFYAHDVNLRFERELDDDGGGATEDFTDDWANVVKKDAFSSAFGLYYASTLIQSFRLVFVDGNMGKVGMPIPIPGPNGTTISELDCKVAEIRDVSGSLKEYMERYKIHHLPKINK